MSPAAAKDRIHRMYIRPAMYFRECKSALRKDGRICVGDVSACRSFVQRKRRVARGAGTEKRRREARAGG